jgi:hypothetical protein
VGGQRHHTAEIKRRFKESRLNDPRLRQRLVVLVLAVAVAVAVGQEIQSCDPGSEVQNRRGVDV